MQIIEVSLLFVRNPKFRQFDEVSQRTDNGQYIGAEDKIVSQQVVIQTVGVITVETKSLTN